MDNVFDNVLLNISQSARVVGKDRATVTNHTNKKGREKLEHILRRGKKVIRVGVLRKYYGKIDEAELKLIVEKYKLDTAADSESDSEIQQHSSAKSTSAEEISQHDSSRNGRGNQQSELILSYREQIQILKSQIKDMEKDKDSYRRQVDTFAEKEKTWVIEKGLMYRHQQILIDTIQKERLALPAVINANIVDEGERGVEPKKGQAKKQHSKKSQDHREETTKPSETQKQGSQKPKKKRGFWSQLIGRK